MSALNRHLLFHRVILESWVLWGGQEVKPSTHSWTCSGPLWLPPRHSWSKATRYCPGQNAEAPRLKEHTQVPAFTGPSFGCPRLRCLRSVPTHPWATSLMALPISKGHMAAPPLHLPLISATTPFLTSDIFALQTPHFCDNPAVFFYKQNIEDSYFVLGVSPRHQVTKLNLPSQEGRCGWGVFSSVTTPRPRKMRQHHYLILCVRLQGFCLKSLPHLSASSLATSRQKERGIMFC